MNGISPYTELNRPADNGGRTALVDMIALVPDEMSEVPQSFDHMLQGNQALPEEIEAALPKASQAIAPGGLLEEMGSFDIGAQVKLTVAEGPSGEDSPSIPATEPSLVEAGLQVLPVSDGVQGVADEPTQPQLQNDPIAALPSMIVLATAESEIMQAGGSRLLRLHT